jgi:3-oxoacyl-[acyl-carrier protein] reductase
MLLAHKVALITGSARGTGAGIARVFAREGASVVINQVREEGNPQGVLEEIQTAGGKALCVKADITDEAQVREMVKKAEEAFGKVDILVSNYAAAIPRKGFQETTWADWQAQIDTTLKAAFLCTQAVLPGMKARRGGVSSASTLSVFTSLLLTITATLRPRPQCWDSPAISPSKLVRTISQLISFLRD